MKTSNALTKILAIIVISTCFSFGAMARDASSFLPEQRIFADFIPQGKWEEVHASIPGSQFTDSTRTQLVRNFFTQVGWHEVQKREFTDASSNGVDFPRRFWELNPTLDELTKKGWISVEDFLEIVRGYGIYIPDMRSGVVAEASNAAQLAQAKVVTASAEVLRFETELNEVKASLEQFRGQALSEADRKQVGMLLGSKKELTKLRDDAIEAAEEAKESARQAAASRDAAQAAASEAVTSALAAGASEDAAKRAEEAAGKSKDAAAESEKKTADSELAAGKSKDAAAESEKKVAAALSNVWAALGIFALGLVALALWLFWVNRQTKRVTDFCMSLETHNTGKDAPMILNRLDLVEGQANALMEEAGKRHVFEVSKGDIAKVKSLGPDNKSCLVWIRIDEDKDDEKPLRFHFVRKDMVRPEGAGVDPKANPWNVFKFLKNLNNAVQNERVVGCSVSDAEKEDRKKQLDGTA